MEISDSLLVNGVYINIINVDYYIIAVGNITIYFSIDDLAHD